MPVCVFEALLLWYIILRHYKRWFVKACTVAACVWHLVSMVHAIFLPPKLFVMIVANHAVTACQ